MDKFRDKVLEYIYFNPKSGGSFGGARKLWLEARKVLPRLKLTDVKNWLVNYETYSLFRQVRRRFPRLKVLVDRIDEQWQIDLLDMSWFSKDNDGIKYLLVVIDVLSRYAWARPLRAKDGVSVSTAMESILKERVPEKIQSDMGKEFLNTNFKRLMKTYKINHFTTTDDQVKCALVERLNRTLRSRIYRYMFATDSKRYIDGLQDIIKGYNKSYHRTIQMAPEDVSMDNLIQVKKNILGISRKNNKKPLKVGDFVRIQKWKGKFEKGSTANWTREIFRIAKVKRGREAITYRIEDLSGEPVTSVHYPEELQKVI